VQLFNLLPDKIMLRFRNYYIVSIRKRNVPDLLKI
jgi:hypothetical protein